jgi:uncharacterized membrane protein
MNQRARGAFTGLRAAAAVAGVMGCVSGAAAQFFALGSGNNSYALSADGTTVAGPTASGHFRWMQSGGVQPLALPAGSYIRSLSGDGSVVFGQTSPNDAFRLAGGVLTPYANVSPVEMSRDGQVMSGMSPLPGVGAVRWTVSDPTPVPLSVDPSHVAVPHAIDADGDVIGGEYQGLPSTRGMRWTLGGGLELFASPSPFTSASAWAVTGDGSIMAGKLGGFGGSAPFPPGPVGQVEVLPLLAGHTFTHVSGISGDGHTIVGTSGSQAAVWTGNTVQSLESYLAGFGITTSPGWFFYGITDISEDGRVLTGNGFFNGVDQGWVAVVPGPGGLVVLVVGVVGRRRRRGA